MGRFGRLDSRLVFDINLKPYSRHSPSFQIAQLVEDVRRLQTSLAALQEAHAQQLQRLEERLDEKKQHIARLEARLDTQRDYEDIKREIR